MLDTTNHVQSVIQTDDNTMISMCYTWITCATRSRQPPRGSHPSRVPYFGVHWNAVSSFSSKLDAAARLTHGVFPRADLGPQKYPLSTPLTPSLRVPFGRIWPHLLHLNTIVSDLP